MTMNYRANRKRRFKKHMWNGRSQSTTFETVEELSQMLQKIRDLATKAEVKNE